MSDLFRQEAVDHHARHAAPGDLVRVGSRWVARIYRGLLLLVMAGLVAGWIVRVDGERLLLVLLGHG